jgi:hypothetical protein
MSKKIFVQDKNLTEDYQRNFNKQGIIGYYRNPHEPAELPAELMIKTYYLVLDGKITFLGDSLDSVYKKLLDIYFAEQNEECFAPVKTPIVAERKKPKLTPKRKMLLEQVNMVRSWGRGVIAKIAENLGRKVGAVRQMLSVLTKIGLLVRIKRGHYAVSSETKLIHPI